MRVSPLTALRATRNRFPNPSDGEKGYYRYHNYWVFLAFVLSNRFPFFKLRSTVRAPHDPYFSARTSNSATKRLAFLSWTGIPCSQLLKIVSCKHRWYYRLNRDKSSLSLKGNITFYDNHCNKSSLGRTFIAPSPTPQKGSIEATTNGGRITILKWKKIRESDNRRLNTSSLPNRLRCCFTQVRMPTLLYAAFVIREEFQQSRNVMAWIDGKSRCIQKGKINESTIRYDSFAL